ncbi:hypothetical protein SDC9_96254 [bioreactor metagenome]|uniref:Uncharacterized protein n=1 Tax=bioreactor metagenome TaxID=1076179 RepID=A0A645AIP4_9ZZZZ
MAGPDAAAAEGAVAQVAQVELAGEGIAPLGFSAGNSGLGPRRVDQLGDAFEQIGQRQLPDRLFDGEGRAAGFGVKPEAGQSGAVLAAVVLLFQQQRHFFKPVKRGAVFADEMIEGPPQPQQRYPAFVFDRIRHDGFLRILNIRTAHFDHAPPGIFVSIFETINK